MSQSLAPHNTKFVSKSIKNKHGQNFNISAMKQQNETAKH